MLHSELLLPISIALDTPVNILLVVLLYLVTGCLSPLSASAAEQNALEELSALTAATVAANPLAAVCQRFNGLNTRIRDGRIDRTSARNELKPLLAELREGYYRLGGRAYAESAWFFPLAGYDARAIGGGRCHGYSARGYDFYSGNRHGGHPSFDIFIHDRNQDGLDDRSGSPVDVRSLTGGVVVALEREWQAGSPLRGGKYLWIYDPANELLVYYAHNGALKVELGDLVKPGDLLASVGRSGYNAAKRRSPTHLHLTVLRVRDGQVVPLDIYQELKNARSLGAH